MKEKIAKVNFNKGGGSSVNGVTPRISIPKAWIDELGITQENNLVKLIFKKDKIIIQKNNQ